MGLDNFENAIIAGGTAALASLPMYILSKAMPSLATELRNKKAEWMEKFEIAINSCEEMESMALDGGNPYEDWIALAKKVGWKEQIEKSGGNPVVAKKKVQAGFGNCTQWVGGIKAGCGGKAPINITADPVKAGYMQMAGLKPNLNALGTANTAAANTRLKRVLGRVEEAAAFAEDVLGEVAITDLGSDAGPQTSPGVGLISKYDEEKLTVAPALTRILDDLSTDPEDWEAVMAPTAGISQGLVDAYRQLSKDDKALAKSALVADLAFARVIEKALMLKRVMLSGLKEPHIYNSPANEAVRERVDALQEEIEHLLLERKIGKQLTSGAALEIIKHSNSLNTVTTGYYPDDTPSSGSVVIPGGGKPKEGAKK